MHRFNKFQFAVADFVAWLLLAFSVICAIAFPFVGPVHARMSHQSISTLSMVCTSVMWLAVAVGAHAITRRQALGLPLVFVPSVALLVSGHFLFALAFAASATIVFAAPFLLVFLQARSTSPSQPAA